MKTEIKPGKGFINNWTIEEIRSFFNLNPNLSDQKVEEMIPVLNSDDLILKREDEEMFDPFYQEPDLGEWWSR